MNVSIEALAARAEIQDLLYRYCRGVDRADVDLIKSVYHPGATDDHGLFSGDAAEFAEFVVPLLCTTYRTTQHQLSNMLIDVDAGQQTARAETYFTAYHVEHAPDADTGRPRMVVFGGRYLDELDHRDGHWGIANRVVVHDWSDAYPLTLYPAVDSFARSARQGSALIRGTRAP